MGEYISYKGENIKLGTCEDLTDYTFQQIRTFVLTGARKLEGNSEPAEYSNPANGWRYRFPFRYDLEPDNLDYGVPLHAPRALVEGCEHSDVYTHIGPSGMWSNIGVNVFIPCPNSAEGRAHPDLYQQGATQEAYIMVKAVGWRAGGWRVIFQCPYCKDQWAFDRDEAAVVAASNPQHQHVTPDDLLSVYDWDRDGNRKQAQD